MCPFPNAEGNACRDDFGTMSALRKHFQQKHNRLQKQLLKPQESEPSNWRRVQNSNKRFNMSTVKLKLCSLVNGGKSVVDGRKTQRQPTAATPEAEKMAKELVEMLNEKAIELSKVAIIFSHLVYFKVYNAMETLDDQQIDELFGSEWNGMEWHLIMLRLKKFIRATSNSAMAHNNRNIGKPKGLFVSLDDSEFFEICKQYKVKSSFEEFSQNSWNHIHQTFNVNFKTNISTHLYRRIRNWFHFKLLDGKKTKEVRGKENRKIIGEKVYHTMRYLFDPKESARPEYVQFELIDELQKICKFPTFNKRGKCYFSRLYYNYNDDDNSNATKRKPPQKKRKANSKKARKTTQNNGPRLLWHQMIPAMLRLQSWIATTNSKRRVDFITSSVNKSKRRKRKRKGKINNDEKQHMPQRLADKAAIPSKQRKRRKRRRSQSTVLACITLWWYPNTVSV